MTDPRYIPPSERDYRSDGHRSSWDTQQKSRLLDHAVFMDERDARQRDLIKRLLEVLTCFETGELYGQVSCNECDPCQIGNEATNMLLAEARGVEATNE